MSVCGLAHMYSDALCLLPAGHDRGPSPDELRHSDGAMSWIHHELELAVDDDGAGPRRRVGRDLRTGGAVMQRLHQQMSRRRD